MSWRAASIAEAPPRRVSAGGPRVAVADIDATAIQGEVWHRHARTGADFWLAPDPPPDGRWQRGDVVRAIYLADSEETAWAEWYRALSERGLPPDYGFPRALWRVRVSVERLADLSTPQRLERAGLPVPRPRLGEWPAFQAVGEALFAAGFRGILAPSAARPDDGRSLTVFRTEHRVPGLTPVGRPRRIASAPALPRGLRT